MIEIGVTARLAQGDPAAIGGRRKDQWGVEQALHDRLGERGASVSVLVPPPPEAAADVARRWLGRIGALVLQGGADVRQDAAVDEDRREAFERALLVGALERGLPVLGICRGMQLINVAMGGSLRRLPATPAGHVHSDPGRYEAHTHPLQIAADGALARLYPERRARVSSMHSDGIDRLGDGLSIDAWCPLDHTIEAVRGLGGHYLRGVQWHPEFHGAAQLAAEPLFDELLAAAR